MFGGCVSLLPLDAGGKAWRVLVMQCLVWSLTIQPGMQRGYLKSLLGGRNEVKASRRLINAVILGYMSADQVITEAHHTT